MSRPYLFSRITDLIFSFSRLGFPVFRQPDSANPDRILRYDEAGDGRCVRWCKGPDDSSG
jgi:hypothetical protein